jgi:O-antigen/teichoic acid export membrane protein
LTGTTSLNHLAQDMPLGEIRQFLDEPGRIIPRLLNSAVIWSWGLNLLRLAAGMILLPLVLRIFTKPELGMYYVLLSLSAIGLMLDFGFSVTIARFVGYAVSGADSLQAKGYVPVSGAGGPNHALLWQLYFAACRLYRYLSLAVLLVTAVWGVYLVELRIEEVPSALAARLALVVTVAAAALDVHSTWATSYLRGLNEVLEATRLSFLTSGVRLALAAVLLLSGLGLLSLPLAGLSGSLLLLALSRRACRRRLDPEQKPTRVESGSILKTLWPNSWRLGLQLMSGYLTVNANTAICLHFFGLEGNASYGLSVQFLNILVGMSSVWLFVKWPLIVQARAKEDFVTIRKLLSQRVWLQFFTFLAGAIPLVLAGAWLINFLGKDKELLPVLWLSLLAVTVFLDSHCSVWGTLFSTANEIPTLWPILITNIASLVLSISLIHFTSLGLGGLALGPLIAGLVFNYWYWPLAGARSLQSTFWTFLTEGLRAR